jgi:tetratricopeptide (TPR) repeat protein
LLSRLLANGEVSPAQRRSAYIGRGVSHGNNGEFQSAISDFSAAIAIDPKQSDAYYDRALLESDVGDVRGGLADLYTIESAANVYPKYYYFRGYMHFEGREYDLAIADLTVAVQTMPKDPNIVYRRGKAYAAEGKRDLAVADFDTTIRLKPEDAELLSGAYRWRGTEALADRRYDAAIAAFSAVLKLNPQDADASMRRANAYYAEAKYPQVIEDTSRVIRSGGLTSEVFPWPGVVDPTLCFPDRIVDQYNAGMRVPGVDPYAHVLRARAYVHLGKKDEALADYRVAVRVIPAGADASVAQEMAQIQ